MKSTAMYWHLTLQEMYLTLISEQDILFETLYNNMQYLLRGLKKVFLVPVQATKTGQECPLPTEKTDKQLQYSQYDKGSTQSGFP